MKIKRIDEGLLIEGEKADFQLTMNDYGKPVNGGCKYRISRGTSGS